MTFQSSDLSKTASYPAVTFFYPWVLARRIASFRHPADSKAATNRSPTRPKPKIRRYGPCHPWANHSPARDGLDGLDGLVGLVGLVALPIALRSTLHTTTAVPPKHTTHNTQHTTHYTLHEPLGHFHFHPHLPFYSSQVLPYLGYLILLENWSP